MGLAAMGGMSFGCDPELFVVDGNGEFVYPDFIPGTKEEPYAVELGAVQRDGMAAEFNIEPVTNFSDWKRNVNTVMKQMEGMLPVGYQLVPVASAVFSEQAWNRAPDEAKVLGCNPDFNAWTGDVNPPPDGEAIPRFRTAAGHLHFGWTENADASNLQHLAACRDLVKQLDWYLGLWSLQLDKDNSRRNLYGKAGSMRYKPYGVEYRVLSNFWLANDNRKESVWDRMQHAIWDMRNNFLPSSDFVTAYEFNNLVIRSIDESEISPTLKANFKYPITSIHR